MKGQRRRGFLRDNALSLAFLLLLLGSLVGQAISGVAQYNEEARTVGIRIGVVDSKRNPAASNHRRYARVVALVEQVLVPLAERHPIASVRVK